MADFQLIGVAGKAGCGKDTVGEFLNKYFYMYRYALADPIKQAASEMFGIPIEDFYDTELKEQSNNFWGYSPRYIAQMIGTEGGRNLFRKDIWLKRAEMEMMNLDENQLNGMVITDIRFPNEVEWVHEQGGRILKLTRDDAVETLAHESESYDLEIREDDFEYANDGTMEDLFDFVEYMADMLDISAAYKQKEMHI